MLFWRVRGLDPKSRKALTYFHDYSCTNELIVQKEKEITSTQILSNHQRRLVLAKMLLAKFVTATVNNVKDFIPKQST